jgi:tetratricopeptide (TPR) repeat protein
VTLAQRSSDGELLLEAYHCRWSTAFFRGDVAEALDNTLVGVETYDLARHRHLGHAFGGHDPGVCAHVVRANALQLSGDALGAKASARQGVALAETLGHPNTLGHALHNACMAHQLGGEREAALAAAQRAADLAEKFALSPWRASSLVVKGWATAVGGVEEAAQLIDREIDKATAAGPVPQYYLGLAAEVLLAAGRPADGLAHLDHAIATVDEPGVGFYLPEIYRLRGECRLALGRDRRRGEAVIRDGPRRCPAAGRRDLRTPRRSIPCGGCKQPRRLMDWMEGVSQHPPVIDRITQAHR